MSSLAINPDLQHSSTLRAERLFRAAVTAYCAIIRPSKSDAIRLDDMTLPLLSLVSQEGRRYASAALSATPVQHCILIRRLADEPVEISAPLLSRSQNLSDVDLIGLIGRHGIAHARAISRRPALNSNIAKLIVALGAVEETVAMVAAPAPIVTEIEAPAAAAAEKQDTAEETRTLLRGMMLPSAKAEPVPLVGDINWSAAETAYPKLLSTAMAGNEALFDTALADALDISFGAVRSLDDDEAPGLAIALRALALPLEKAFLIAALVYPYGFARPGNAQDFVRNYRELDQASARATISKWRLSEHQRRYASTPDWDADPIAEPANDAGEMLVALRA